MRKLIFTLLAIWHCSLAIAQIQAEVPAVIHFADMKLKLTDGAIKDIQADVDALTRSEQYFIKKLKRVDMYFPIIERIFAEENLPDDFKYLVIQESALISDAVSSSNAIGFWQFKEASGLENGLRIDNQIDERKNIVSATRAAATYLKSHNFFFDNWAYSLIAYQTGRGGAEKHISSRNYGKKHLTITKNTYWYLKKYLAHKIAFEQALGTSQPEYFLKEETNTSGKSLRDISKEYAVSQDLIEEYNKWIKRGRIPEDKTYTVIVPLAPMSPLAKRDNAYHHSGSNRDLPGEVDMEGEKQFPIVEGPTTNGAAPKTPLEIEINGKDGILAATGYDVAALAAAAGLTTKKFRKFNDMSLDQSIIPGEIYYTQRKRNRAKFYYHTVKPGETMWAISQKYGLKLHKLYRKNRMEGTEKPKPGRVLWLRHNRPKNIAVEYREIQENVTPKKKVAEPIPEVSPKSPAVTETNIPEKIFEEADTTIVVANERIDEPNNTQKDSATDTVNLAEKPIVQNTDISSTDNEIKPDITIEEETTPDEDINFIWYEVQKGDTFFGISNRYKMRISSLLSLNNLTIKDTLAIGQQLKVLPLDSLADTKEEPSKTTKTAVKEKKQRIEHKVTHGDTMYSLAKKYEVSLQQIMEWNNKSDYSLKEGEILYIHGN